MQTCLTLLITLTKQIMHLILHRGESGDKLPNFIDSLTLSSQKNTRYYFLSLIRPDCCHCSRQFFQWRDHATMHGKPEETGSNEDHKKGNSQAISKANHSSK